jgi:hypothetical protein
VTASNGKRWRAQIAYDSKNHNLGCFDTKQEAALAYDRAVRECGKDKPMNYDSITAEEAAAQAEHIPKPRPPSGFYGVYPMSKRWSAKIYCDSKNHSLGSFDTKQEAALVYDRAARECGEDKPLNFDSIKAAEEAAVQAKVEYTRVHPRPRKKVPPRPTSGFYGVRAAKKRWQATICYDNKTHFLGSFGTKQEAALAFDREARQCGQDKPLNYESIAAAEAAAVQAQTEYTLVHDLCAGQKQPRPRPASGFYGVAAKINGTTRWSAQISYNNKKHSLGTFDTKQEAALAYDRAARQCGQDKPSNYDSITAAEEAAVQARTGYILVHGLYKGPQQPKPRPTSGFYGVYARGKRWTANISYGGKQHSLGSFDTKQEAALAYDREASQCGEDKLLSYESIKAAEEAAAQAQADYRPKAGPKQPKPRPASGFYGVSASRKRWTATIYFNSKVRHLGCFGTRQEAALAHDRQARQCGKDKPLNYESITAAEKAAARSKAQQAKSKPA